MAPKAKIDSEDYVNLGKLSPAHQQVIKLYDSLQRTPKISGKGHYDTMAETLNIAIGTVKSRLNRARIALVRIRQADETAA